ncbi:Aste57867_3694 [Aphanomyces stellatus]|uniref:Aste57867_3694 protein n=1 Tax=Aphanomyces stellatus TaxID=120398 RepID=A0A485KA66_9STRA|nr:hypothetical protein As57867_003683 [Aphanomyces stellatus]VFT80849.1 Aste57867_3694 [Aphanomyces stellatus]
MVRASLVCLACVAAAISVAPALSAGVHMVQPDEMLGAACAAQADCGFLPGLACIQKTCQLCQQHADCATSPFDFSKRCVVDAASMVALDGQLHALSSCMEKNLFDPFTSLDSWSSFLGFLCTALGSAAGTGGGGLLVPMFILAFGLGPKHAIPMSKATIFGGAIATFVMNFRKKHPYQPRRPLIDYTLSAMMEPPTLIGTIFGVMANATFPSWLILLLLLSLLSFMAVRTLQKVQKIDAQEAKTNNAEAIQLLPKTKLSPRDEAKDARIRRDDFDDFESLPPLVIPPGTDKATYLAEIQAHLYKEESNVFPIAYVMPLVLCWLIIFVQSLFRGGHGTPSIVGIGCGSTTYWLLTFLPLLALILITWLMGQRLRVRNQLRVLSGADFAVGDLHWTRKTTQLVFPMYCFVAGIASGLLGIGGGMVQNPIMLEYGLLPSISSASASYMILFTSSATTLQFAVAGQFPGQLQYDYIVWYALMGFLGGVFGQNCVGYIVRKYKRSSILVYVLAFMIAASAIAMGITGYQTVVHDFSKGVHLGFSGVCRK